jgi:hypothetical protein
MQEKWFMKNVEGSFTENFAKSFNFLYFPIEKKPSGTFISFCHGDHSAFHRIKPDV